MPFGHDDLSIPEDFIVEPINTPRKKPRFIPPPKQKGMKDLFGRDLKRQILEAAASQGFNGAGQGGLQGFLQMCASRYPKAYLHVLAKLVPQQLQAEVASSSISNVHVHSIPAGCFLSPQDIERMRAGSFPFEHVPEASPSPPMRLNAPEPAEQPVDEDARLKVLEDELNSLS